MNLSGSTRKAMQRRVEQWGEGTYEDGKGRIYNLDDDHSGNYDVAYVGSRSGEAIDWWLPEDRENLGKLYKG